MINFIGEAHDVLIKRKESTLMRFTTLTATEAIEIADPTGQIPDLAHFEFSVDARIINLAKPDKEEQVRRQFYATLHTTLYGRVYQKMTTLLTDSKSSEEHRAYTNVMQMLDEVTHFYPQEKDSD